MSLFDNARDSIIMGLEDYDNPDSKRLVSCVRNLFAGILLLFKYKLSRFSPEGSNDVLIKQKVKPKLENGVITWVGEGNKTLDVQQIKDRFDALGVEVDWKRINKINIFRNDAEHYFVNLSKNAMQTMLADSFVVIRDFITENLSEDPKEFLGDDAWSVLLTAQDVYMREKSECEKSLENVDWKSLALDRAMSEFVCEDCGSDLICMSLSSSSLDECCFSCRSCGKIWNFHEIAEESIGKYFEYDNYIGCVEGGEVSTVICPQCGMETYVVVEGRCVVCDLELDIWCKRCAAEIPVSEIDGSGFCSWCDHMMNKDD